MILADSTTNAALISAFGVVTAAGVGYLGVRVRQVHIMVNSQRTEMVKRIDQLSDSLRNANIQIPATPPQTTITTTDPNPTISPSP